jgi:hypothetical protein
MQVVRQFRDKDRQFASLILVKPSRPSHLRSRSADLSNLRGFRYREGL